MSKELNQGPQGPLADFLTELELGEIFGINKGALSRLRLEQGLPYCKVNDRSRLYPESLVREWLNGRVRVVVKSSDSASKPDDSASDTLIDGEEIDPIESIE